VFFFATWAASRVLERVESTDVLQNAAASAAAAPAPAGKGARQQHAARPASLLLLRARVSAGGGAARVDVCAQMSL
jgi:hypothetical protein